MTGERKIERREFMQASAATIVAGLGMAGPLRGAAREDSIEEAVRRVGQLPRHPLGNSGRQISVLVGAGTWDTEAAEAAARCGINFWHKADDWSASSVPQTIRKNREAHYCQVSVDRVRGNHERGEIDEEAHYQFVKQAVQQTGLRYFDDMQLHFGYHNVQELKTNRGFVKAFERLKKEGLVRHLCLSQHSYNGNSRVPGGQSAPEILTAVAADGLYEHAQFVYSYDEGAAAAEFVGLAKKKGFGTIGMKTTRGAGRMAQDRAFMKDLPAGTTPYHALARWLTTRSGLDGAVIQINSLSQFIDTYSGAGKAMRGEDREAIRRMTAYANSEVCRLCNDCMGRCGQAVPIADIFRYERYARDYGDLRGARSLYRQLEVRADSCTECGKCVPHCPLGLQIPERMAEADRMLA